MLDTTLPDLRDNARSDVPERLGHFQIVRELGAGGMGVVYEGRDDVLGRRVALKLLHPTRNAAGFGQARLLREAQALAKLSHPNVVTVFEIGLAGSVPFIAMELVEGVTLNEWIRKPRAWRDVLDVFIAVGHGLAAAHSLGLVHRDFKPSNVLLDARGVPKLGDFGLVGAESTDGDKTPTSPNSTLTAPGDVMGTPAYMAPEQRHGLPVDARADQYSFAKSLREALGAQVPAALEPILARAMAGDAEGRYPAMAPLLDALARVRRGNRRRWIAAGGTLGVAGAIALAWGFGRAQAVDDPCPRPTGRMDAIWSAARRGDLGQHLEGIDPSHGRERFTAAAAVLDRGATRWMDLHVDACKLSHEGRQSDALLDRRMACLDDALYELDQTVGTIEAARSPATLDEAMRAVVGLPTLDACADVETLTEKLPRPASPLQRAEADAITRETVDIDVTTRTGGTRGVLDRAQTAVARARALGHAETLARALRTLAAIQMENEADDALATLREAITAASAAHDDRVAVELWSKLLAGFVARKRAAEAQTLLPAAEAALARTSAGLDASAPFADSKTQVLVANGDIPRARQLLIETTAALEAAGAAAPASPLAPLMLAIRTRGALVAAAANDFEATAAGLRAVIPLADAQYGPDHPILLRVHFNLGVALRRLRDETAALVEFREAARIGEARLAPSPSLADILLAVGTTLLQMENAAEARGYIERALAMQRATLPAGDRRFAGTLGALGSLALEAAEYDKARALFDENIAIHEKVGDRNDVNWAHGLFNRARIEFETQHCAVAFPLLDKALALYVGIGEKNHRDIDETLTLIADCQLSTKQHAAAARTSERVLAGNGDENSLATARFIRGQALAAMGDRRAGVAEVRAAQVEMKRLEFDAGTQREVETWLAKH